MNMNDITNELLEMENKKNISGKDLGRALILALILCDKHLNEIEDLLRKKI